MTVVFELSGGALCLGGILSDGWELWDRMDDTRREGVSKAAQNRVALIDALLLSICFIRRTLFTFCFFYEITPHLFRWEGLMGVQHREGVKRGWRGGEGGIVVAVAVVVVVANSAIELDVIVKSHMYKDQVKDRRTGRQSPRCQACTFYLPDGYVSFTPK